MAARRSNISRAINDYQRQRRANLREQQRQERMHAQEQRRIQREAERRAKAAARQRELDAHETAMAEAENLTEDLTERVAELSSLLTASLDIDVGVPFHTMKYPLPNPQLRVPPRLTQPVPPPVWSSFMPPQPGGLASLFGGKSRYERQLEVAGKSFEAAKSHHAAQEQARRSELSALHAKHNDAVAMKTQAVRRHNAVIDEWEKQYQAGEPEAVERYVELALQRSTYPDSFPFSQKIAYRPEPKELWIESELPTQDVVPTERGYRYVKTRKQIEPLARPAREIKDLYGSVVAQAALRTLREAFDAVAADLVDAIYYNGHVSTRDKATGKAIHPCLVSVRCDRETFNDLELEFLSPKDCLKHLNALVSRHPYDLEAVEPFIDFDLSRFRFGEEFDAASGLDGRSNLIEMNPLQFEHLVKQLFEAHGMKGWTTTGSRDEGVDAVVTNPDPVVGGLCIIQAKRYKNVIPLDAVRSLVGAMDDKRATTGILVTTSWFGNGAHEFAKRNGRIRLIDGTELKHLLKEHLDLDVRIELPKAPPRKRRLSPRISNAS